MEKTTHDVDEFLRGLEGPRADAMRTLDATIHPVMTGLSRTLWEGVFWGGSQQIIIGYGDLVQSRPRGRTVEWFVVGLAEQKDYVSLYVNAVENGKYIGAQFAEALGRVKLGASSISFRTLDDIDLDVVVALVRRARELTVDRA